MKLETLKEIRRHLRGLDVAIQREIEDEENKEPPKQAASEQLDSKRS